MSEGMSDIKRKTFVTQYQRTYRSSSSIDTHEFEKMRRRNINQNSEEIFVGGYYTRVFRIVMTRGFFHILMEQESD